MALNRICSLKDAQYILYPDSQEFDDLRINWRTSHVFPYIYVSFSYDQFVRTYGKRYIERISKNQKLTELNPFVIEVFSHYLQQEYILRTRMPLVFLDLNATQTTLEYNNIYFILSDLTLDQNSAYTIAHHNTIQKSKYSAFRQINSLTLTKKDIYMFLHEVAHAIPGFKHLIDYDLIDHPPYINIDDIPKYDCTQTVMSYDCQPAMRNPDTEPDPAKFPTQLGCIDLIAADQFRKEWDRRIETDKEQFIAEMNTIIEEDVDVVEEEIEFPDTSIETKPQSYMQRFFSWIYSSSTNSTQNIASSIPKLSSTTKIQQELKTSFYDRGLAVAVNYACDVVKSCKVYFPPDSCQYLNLYQTSTFFNSSQENTGNAGSMHVALLPASPVPSAAVAPVGMICR